MKTDPIIYDRYKKLTEPEDIKTMFIYSCLVVLPIVIYIAVLIWRGR